MAVLTISQILGLAANAGFSGPDLATAVAVALAESGGKPDNYNPEQQAGAAQGQGSFGLWQIYLTKHPEFDPNQLLMDPQYNANAAFKIYQQAGNSFLPWSTYKYGQYRTYLDQVNAVIAAAPVATDSTDQSTTADGTDTTGTGSGPSGSTVAIIVATGAVLALFLYLRG